jgi:hypothetical protein
VSVPTAKVRAGIAIVALPLLKLIAPVEKLPLMSVTKPVGVELLLLTVTTTVRLSAKETELGEGVKVTVGAAFAVLVTVTEAVPAPSL